MMQWFDSSIRRRLMGALIGIFLATYGLTAIVILTSVRQSLKDTEAGALIQVANQKLGRLNAYFDALSTNLGAWSRLEVMNDIFSGDIDKRITRTLTEVHSQYGLAGQLYVFDREGALVAASQPISSDIMLPPSWHAGEGLRFIGRAAAPLKMDPTVPEAELVALVMPIRATYGGSAPIGTLVATVPWPTVADMVAQDGLPALLVDASDHKVLEASLVPMPTIALPTDDTGLTNLHVAGVSYISGHASTNGDSLTGWAIIAVEPEATVSASVNRVALQLLALGLALFLPISFGIRWVSKRLTDPVNALEATVAEITTAKDLSLRASIDASDEIGRLATAFNQMAESLEQTSREREDVLATLELRVEDRTAALSGANHQLQEAFEKLKTAQSQLVQSEKMASLGQLVAGVAHELNNPISFIYANFPHIEDYIDEILDLFEELRAVPMPPEAQAALEAKIADLDLDLVRDDLKKIVASGKAGASRIKEIVLALRSFSRLDEAEKKAVALEKGLDDTLAILNHYIKGGITVDRRYELKEPVDCHAGQINQVFTNIIFNAIQAMGQSGSLGIITRREGDWAVVEIFDSGPGIPTAIIDRIFDPFFTTKKVGEGTGLGLSISYGIIEKHGGRLEVDSTPDVGTRFTIRLPLQTSASQTAATQTGEIHP